MLVALGVVLILVITGGDGGGLLGIGGPDDTVPSFDFSVGRTQAVATSEKTDAETLASAAERVAGEATPVIDLLYTEAFLDPANWRDGEYDEVWEVFDPSALQAAQEGVETVTLGATAGDAFDEVQPDRSKVSFKVLFDDEGSPTTVVAIVAFQALAKGKDGTYTEIVSEGQYFLRDAGGGWKVFSFDVKRADHEAAAPNPAPSATPSA